MNVFMIYCEDLFIFIFMKFFRTPSFVLFSLCLFLGLTLSFHIVYQRYIPVSKTQTITPIVIYEKTKYTDWTVESVEKEPLETPDKNEKLLALQQQLKKEITQRIVEKITQAEKQEKNESKNTEQVVQKIPEKNEEPLKSSAPKNESHSLKEVMYAVAKEDIQSRNPSVEADGIQYDKKISRPSKTITPRISQVKVQNKALRKYYESISIKQQTRTAHTPKKRVAKKIRPMAREKNWDLIAHAAQKNTETKTHPTTTAQTFTPYRNSRARINQAPTTQRHTKTNDTKKRISYWEALQMTAKKETEIKQEYAPRPLAPIRVRINNIKSAAPQKDDRPKTPTRKTPDWEKYQYTLRERKMIEEAEEKNTTGFRGLPRR